MRRSSFARFPFDHAPASILAALVSAALLTSCADSLDRGTGTQPTEYGDPVAPIAGTGNVAGFVVDPSHDCIIGARVTVVDGTRAGAVFTQTKCGFWDYGSDIGFWFYNLPTGTAVTLRATADGYKPSEVTVQAAVSYSYSTIIVLQPL